MRRFIHSFLSAAGALVFVACTAEFTGFEVPTGNATGTGGQGQTGDTVGNASGSGGMLQTVGTGGAVTGSTGTGTGTSTGTGTGGGGGSVESVPDPNLEGPFKIAKLTDTFVVPSTGHSVKMYASYPTAGPKAGPYPVILVGHGFQTSVSQYESYLQRLATFGYVAIAPDFPAPFIGNKHLDNGRDLDAGLDWALTNATLKGLVDANNAGATGHSLGGKAAVLAAAADPRIKASITLDPVDSSVFCSLEDCPDASNKLPLPIPMGFVGETLDGSGSFQPCAPAADNFQTFFAKTSGPSLQVEVLGANHLSFTDNPNGGFCKTPTAKHDDVLALSHAMVVAFYERHLRGKSGYEAYLTGSEAKARYVATGLALIQSK